MTTLLKNGILVDPSQKIHSAANLIVESGKIRACTLEEPSADRVLDVRGKVVSPGFIDAHMHEGRMNPDGSPDEDIFLALLSMGVTSALGGNCGNNTVDRPSDYLDLADRRGLPVNLGLFAGHTDARVRAGGTDKYRPVSPGTLEKMKADLRASLEAGCIGISFGVKYVPGTTFEELLAVCSLCKEKHKPVASHIREDAAGAPEAAREMAEVGRILGIPVEISHIGSMAGFGQMRRTLQILDTYRLSGVEIGIDCYPYDAFSTDIGETTYDDGWLERYRTGYDSIELCDGEYAGRRCTEELFRKLRREAPGTITVCHVMRPEEVEMALLHPNVILATDGYMHHGMGHPRAAGSCPRFIRDYVRTGKLTLDEAVNKMSCLPAERFRLSGKGTLKPGADADLVIFDPEKIEDRATYAEPMKPPAGIAAVLIAGETAVENGAVVNSRLGRALRF